MKNRLALTISFAIVIGSSILGVGGSPAVAASVNATSPTAVSGANATTNPTPVYRFYKNDGSHFFTNNESEKNTIIATAPAYSYEGIAFYSFPTQVPGTQPVYRFYNFLQGVHFFTINYNEYQTVLNTAQWTFRYEGIAYYAQPSQVANTTAVYRFYKFQQGVHFYTSNQSESNNLINTASSSYRYEGVAYYLPTQLTFTGTGTGATDSFVLPKALDLFRTSYTGTDNFIVDLKQYSTGSYYDSVANDIGTTNSTKAFGTTEDRYVLQVTAATTGTWSITVEQPTASAGLVADFSGTGNQATTLFTTLAGAKTFNYTYNGTVSSNFIVWLLDANGNYVDLIANDLGASSGSTFEVTDTANYIMQVTADGPWTISIR